MARERCIICGSSHFLRLPGIGRPALWCAFLILVFPIALQAQELVRSSALPLPIQTFRRPPEAFFRLGPFDGDVTGTAGTDYTDNANLSHTNKLGRLSLFQGLNLDVTWVVSHLSQLEIVFGGQLTEDFYANGDN